MSACDKATNKEQKIAIQSSGGLSKTQIENMIRESEVNAENDKRKRDLIEEINKAESIMHDTESKLEEFKTQLYRIRFMSFIVKILIVSLIT